MASIDNPLEVFFDLVPTGAALYAPLYDAGGELVDFRFVRLNPVGQRLLGLPAQPPRTLREYYPNSAPTGIFDQYRTAFLTGQASTYDVPYEGEGLDTYFRLVAQRSGELLVVSFTDMADLPRSGAEQALRDSRARAQARRADAETRRAELESVFAQAPVGLVLFQGPEYRIDLANAMMGQMWGRAVPQVLGQPVLDAMPEFQAQGFPELLADVYHRGTPYNLRELPVTIARTHTGLPAQGFFNVVYQPHRDLHGDIVGIVCLVVEVTDQVLARQQVELLNQELEARVFERTQALRHAQATGEQQRQQQHEILTRSPVAIAAFSGPEHRFSFTNPRYDALVGHRAALGRTVAECFPEAAGQGFLDLLDDVYRTGRPFESRETPTTLTLPDQPGTVSYFLDVSYQPLRDEQGQTSGVLAFILDVTEQVRARQQVEVLNEELHASNAQLTRTNTDLDTFVYTASHDLKAPITNIESLVLALRDTLPAVVQQDELVARLLGLLDATVVRFQGTIAQLTDIARLQLAHVGPAEPMVLATVVENVRLDLAPAIGAADAQFMVEVAPDLEVSFSPANLRSIVYNLLSNAVKYRALDRPAQVQVRAAQTPQGVVLTVQDNGLGLSKGQQRQLFGLFQRLHTHVEGTGVGLYITKRLVENAGGTIAVQSQPDVGTAFTVTFPA